MSSRSDRLKVYALKLEELQELFSDPAEREPNRFPEDPDKPTDENVPMSPHHYPGILSESLGGPKRKQHRPHQYEGPRGVAEADEEEADEERL